MEEDNQSQNSSLLNGESDQNTECRQTNDSTVQSNSFCAKLKDANYRRNVFHSLAVCFAFCAFGFQIGQRGPAFLDLQQITDTDMKKASTFFTAIAVGNLCGSLFIGFINNRLNKILLILAATLLLSATVTVVPLCSEYVAMLAILWANAFCMGWLNTAGNAYLLLIWGASEGRSYMQALHSIFAFGAVISPLCTAPFLAQRSDNISTIHNASGFLENHHTFYRITNNTNFHPSVDVDTTEGQPNESKLIYAFAIAGVFQLLTSIPLLLLYIKSRSRAPQSSTENETLTPKKTLPLPTYIITVLFVDSVFMCYCAMEDTFASYLSTFTVLHLQWTKAQGSQVTSTFWASFSAARFLGIVAVRYIKPGILLSGCLISIILNFISFALCSYYHIEDGVWVFAVCVGLSMSVVFPTGFSWIQENILIVTGRVASSIVIAASIGTMLNPLLIGYLMQNVSSMWYCYLLVIESGCLVLLATFFVLYSKIILPKRRVHATTTYIINN